jgi:hypothetical protein
VDTGNDSTLPFDGGSGVDVGNFSAITLHSGQDTVSYGDITVDKVDFFLITKVGFLFSYSVVSLQADGRQGWALYPLVLC